MSIYSNLPRMALGFHGCSKKVAMDVLNLEYELKASQNNYDWLGHGIYFWENDPQRAYEFAYKFNKEEPYVIGAVIDLGNCLSLNERAGIELVQVAFSLLKMESRCAGLKIPENDLEKDGYKILRRLDCAVIEKVHTYFEAEKIKGFDTVLGTFPEGRDAYKGSGFKELQHTQICVRNRDCIKGYFLPKNIRNIIELANS